MNKKILVDPAYNKFGIEHKVYQTNNSGNDDTGGIGCGVLGLIMVGGLSALLYAGCNAGCDTIKNWTSPKKPRIEKEENQLTFKTTEDGKIKFFVGKRAQEMMSEAIFYQEFGNKPMNEYEKISAYLSADSNNDHTISYEEAKKYRDKIRNETMQR